MVHAENRIPIERCNVCCITNALLTLLNKDDCIVLFILALTMGNHIDLVNKLDWKKLILHFLFLKSVYALNNFVQDDAGMNQNANMSTVLGRLENFCIWKSFCRLNFSHWTKVKKLNKRKMGYDVGFKKDEYGCNTNKCECAHYNETIIGKVEKWLS